MLKNLLSHTHLHNYASQSNGKAKLVCKKLHRKTQVFVVVENNNMACSFCLYGPKSNGLYCKGRQQRNGLGRINSYLYCRQLLYQRTVTEKKIQVIRLLLLILFLICVIYFLDTRITYVFCFFAATYFLSMNISSCLKCLIGPRSTSRNPR